LHKSRRPTINYALSVGVGRNNLVGMETRIPVERAESGPEVPAYISAIMPAYNCRAFIERSLAPLLAMQERGELCEIIVVDDGSTDGSAAAAASTGTRVIATGGRCGPGAARNLGARQAKGNILWFIDSDVVVHSDAAEHIRRALANTNYLAVFGSYDDAPPAPNFLSQYKNLTHHYYHQTGRGEATTFWAGCGAVRSKAFLQTGGFDALRYSRPSIEDIELGYRLRAAGGQIRLIGELQGTHLKVWTLHGLLTTEIRDRALPWSFLLLNRGHAGDELNISVTERIRALIACLGALVLVMSIAGLSSWWIPISMLGMAFAANIELFTLFLRRNNLFFAIAGLLFHQVYYLYSTAAYCWCWAVNKVRVFIPNRFHRSLRLE
jgi:glycosyltransferase involved in cell wall biosynthesis